MNNDFLIMLGERKYGYYRILHVSKPQAYSKLDCAQRLETIFKQEELLTVIDHLPLQQQRIVDARFNELKEMS